MIPLEGDSTMTADRTVRDNTKTAERQRNKISSSTTTIDTEPGVLLLHPVDMEAIRTGYVDILGPINAIKARAIEAAINSGLDASAILDALEQTALAARPSHAYLCAILRRYITQGIRTAADAEADREAYAARREAANRERAAWYADPSDDMPW
jgi:hypothetical protein